MFYLKMNIMQPHTVKFTALLLALASVLYGCYTDPIPGPQGPPGFDGRDGAPGADGVNVTGLVYDVNFDLTANNDWQSFYSFPTQDEIYNEDVVLVYLLWDQVESEGGELLDVWRQMPVSYFYEAGQLQLNYDFSVGDVRFFAEAAFPLDAEQDIYQDMLARVVVVPAAYSANARTSQTVDWADYDAVSDWLQLPKRSVRSATPFSRLKRP